MLVGVEVKRFHQRSRSALCWKPRRRSGLLLFFFLQLFIGRHLAFAFVWTVWSLIEYSVNGFRCSAYPRNLPRPLASWFWPRNAFLTLHPGSKYIGQHADIVPHRSEFPRPLPPPPPSPRPSSTMSDLKPPYQNPSNGDLIIRTSDCTEYHVHKFLIANISPIFADMLPIPQPAAGPEPAKPVVDVTEPMPVWSAILDLCYLREPAFDDPAGTVENVHALLEAGKKYEMCAVTSRARRALLHPPFLASHPLSVYALACAYQLEDAARRAARETLSLPPVPPFVHGFELISVRTLCHLFDYRKACVSSACEALSLARGRIAPWMQESGCWDSVTFSCGDRHCPLPRTRLDEKVHGIWKTKEYPQALVEYLERLCEKLNSEVRPSLATSPELLTAFIGSVTTACPKCAMKVAGSIVPFSTATESMIERCISGVCDISNNLLSLRSLLTVCTDRFRV